MNCILTGKSISPSTLVVVSQSCSPCIPEGNYHLDSLLTSTQMKNEISDLQMEVERLEKLLQKADEEKDLLEARIEALICEFENNSTT